MGVAVVSKEKDVNTWQGIGCNVGPMRHGGTSQHMGPLWGHRRFFSAVPAHILALIDAWSFLIESNRNQCNFGSYLM